MNNVCVSESLLADVLCNAAAMHMIFFVREQRVHLPCAFAVHVNCLLVHRQYMRSCGVSGKTVATGAGS